MITLTEDDKSTTRRQQRERLRQARITETEAHAATAVAEANLAKTEDAAITAEEDPLTTAQNAVGSARANWCREAIFHRGAHALVVCSREPGHHGCHEGFTGFTVNNKTNEPDDCGWRWWTDTEASRKPDEQARVEVEAHLNRPVL